MREEEEEERSRVCMVSGSREQTVRPCFLLVGEIWDKTRSYHFLVQPSSSPWLNTPEGVGKEEHCFGVAMPLLWERGRHGEGATGT